MADWVRFQRQSAPARWRKSAARIWQALSARVLKRGLKQEATIDLRGGGGREVQFATLFGCIAFW